MVKPNQLRSRLGLSLHSRRLCIRAGLWYRYEDSYYILNALKPPKSIHNHHLSSRLVAAGIQNVAKLSCFDDRSIRPWSAIKTAPAEVFGRLCKALGNEWNLEAGEQCMPPLHGLLVC